MCVLIIEIIMLATGIYVLIAGRIRISQNFYLEGWRARVAGVFLIVPLPLAFLAGMLLGILIGLGTLPQSALEYAGVVDILLIAVALVGLVIYALAVKPKEEAVSTEKTELMED